MSTTAIETQHPRIVVAGDVTVDWMFSVPVDQFGGPVAISYMWEHSSAVAISARPGGASLIAEIVRSLDPDGALAVDGPTVPEQVLEHPHDDTFARTYSVWTQFPVQTGSREAVWRMNRFVGRDNARGDSPVFRPAAGPVSTLIVDDTNFGVRHLTAERLAGC